MVGRDGIMEQRRVIAQKMFDVGAHTLTLHSEDTPYHHAAREKRILPEVLEVASIQWRAIDIHTGCEEKVFPFCACVSTDLCTELLRQMRIPGSSQSDAPSHQVGRSVVSNPKRSIGDAQERNAQARNCTNSKEICPTQQVDFFFQGHLPEKSIDSTL